MLERRIKKRASNTEQSFIQNRDSGQPVQAQAQHQTSGTHSSGRLAGNQNLHGRSNMEQYRVGQSAPRLPKGKRFRPRPARRTHAARCELLQA